MCTSWESSIYSFDYMDGGEKKRKSVVTVVPGRVVVELVQQSVSQHGSVFIYEDVLTAVNTDQQADDV